MTNTKKASLPISLVTPVVDETGETCLRIVSGNREIDLAFGQREVAMMAKAVARALGGTL